MLSLLDETINFTVKDEDLMMKGGRHEEELILKKPETEKLVKTDVFPYSKSSHNFLLVLLAELSM